MNSCKAVFLSYASEDAGAAKGICDVLRAAGIEVWFDQTELRGGDAWDQKIRQQIRDCALFIPIISAHTQARPEGYFRLEWKLAIDRSHLMAAEKAFLVPVVVDATMESEALVPARFREVQWIRVQAAEVPVTFVERIAALLSQPMAPQVAIQNLTAGRADVRRWPIIAIALAFFVVAVLLVAMATRRDGIWPTPTSKLGTKTAVVPVATSPATIPEKSVAVLPFVDMSEKHDQEYFSDGLSEELINLLAQVQDLRVPARTSSFYFKTHVATVEEIGKALHVSHVLEGSVRRSGDALRVTTQLVRADNGYHVWSRTFDEHSGDVFAVQDAIAKAVVAALRISLDGDRTLSSARGTSNPQAYDHVLRGRQLYRQFTVDGWKQAIDAYQEALALDPNYAAAYAGLSEAEALLGDALGNKDIVQKAKEAADKAISVGPDQFAGYVARAAYRSNFNLDWTGARADLQRALELNPGDDQPHYRFASLLLKLGQFQQALEAVSTTVEINPLSDEGWRTKGYILIAMRRLEDAEIPIRRALEIKPASPRNQDFLAELLLLQGRPSDALKAYTTITADGAVGLTFRAIAEHSLGHESNSLKFLQQSIQLGATTAAYQIAEVYAWRGQSDQAFAWLDRAFAQHDGGIAVMQADPLLASVRGDPRYGAMLRKIGLVR